MNLRVQWVNIIYIMLEVIDLIYILDIMVLRVTGTDLADQASKLLSGLATVVQW